MSIPTWGAVFVVAGIAIWAYLAASAALDRREQELIQRWRERWDREQRSERR